MNCVGVIFHFNPDGVLFEFSSNQNDDAVGIVKPKNIKINSKETIPENATTVEQISKFLQVGDELLCHVEHRKDIEKFVYNEEEEELGSDGKVQSVSRKVEIQPRWVATSAELVTDANRSKRDEFLTKSSAHQAEKGVDELDYDDVILIEDVDMFDFEEEKKAADEDNKTDDTAPAKPSTPTKAVAKAAESLAAATTPKQIVKVLAPIKSAIDVQSGQYQTFTETAKLVQLRKPPHGTIGKVNTAIFEIVTGKFEGRKVSVPNLKMSAFGYNMTSANLMLHLKYGEMCTVKYRVVKLKASQDFLAEFNHSNELVDVPLVLQLWFGTVRDTPVDNNDKDFLKWLSDKKISLKEFQNWMKNLVTPKPYLPFVSETKVGKVLRYLRSPNTSVVGVLLEVSEGPGKPNQKSIAILINSDFYVCGVCVLNADLSVFLKVGDSVNCQLRPMTNGDGVALQHFLFQARDLKITQVADLAMVGPNRPTQANLAPAHAPMLGKYLESKGITMEAFEGMRHNGLLEPGEIPSFPPSGLGPIMRPTMMMPRPFGPPPFGIRPMCPGPAMLPGPMGPRPPIAPGPMVPGPGPQADALRPPNATFPGVFGPFVPQVPTMVINIATNIAARAVNIESDDMRIRNLLHSTAEMEVAAKIARNLTQSLIHKMHASVQTRLNTNLPTIMDLKKQQQELEKIQQSVLSGPENQSANKPGGKEQTPPIGEKPGLKRAGSVPNDFTSKQSRFDEKPINQRLGPADVSVHSRLGPPLQNMSVPPPPIPAPLEPLPLNAPTPRGPLPSIQPVSALQINPFAMAPQPEIAQPVRLDKPEFENPFSAPRERFEKPEFENPFSAPREPTDVNRWSPTYQRIQEMSQRFSNPAQSQISGRDKMENVALKDRQLELEIEQQKLWEDYIRKKDSKARVEQEEERVRAENEAKKREAIEMQKFLEEQDKLRQKMILEQKEEEERRVRKQKEEERRLREEEERKKILEEFERDRIRKEEMEKQRIRGEQERLRKEEAERRRLREEQERKRREEMERKRREEQERQRIREEQERKRKEEMEKQRIREEAERQRVREEAERKRKEEIERQRIRDEQERKRKEEIERQKIREELDRKRIESERQKIREEQERMFREELEKIREEEKEKARKAVEQERIRIREEELRKLKLEREETERLRLENEKQREQEMAWTMDMEKRMRKQQEDDERDRKAREMRNVSAYGAKPPGNAIAGGSGHGSSYGDWMSNVPPPPKLTGMYNQQSENRPRPDPQSAAGFRKSDVFGDRVPIRSGSLERSDPRESGTWNPYGRDQDSRIGHLKNPRDLDNRMFPNDFDRDDNTRRPPGGPESGQRPNLGLPPPQFLAGRGRGYDRRY